MAGITRTEVLQAPVTRTAACRLNVATAGEGFVDLTAEARAFLAAIDAGSGILTAFCPHTSAALTLQENADPDVQVDLLSALRALAPRDFRWRHAIEGPDDMPAHVRTLLTGVSLVMPVAGGALALGRWQGLYLIEHRARPHRREVLLSYLGS